MPDEPSLELPSLFKRRKRPAAPAAEERPVLVEEERRPVAGPPRTTRRSTPHLAPLPAAVLTGALVGLLASGLVWSGLEGCSALRGTSSCGGGPGLLVLLLIVVVGVVVARLLLGLLAVPHPASTAYLGVALTTVVALLLVDRLGGALLAAAVTVASAALAFGLAQALTSSNTAPGDRTR